MTRHGWLVVLALVALGSASGSATNLFETAGPVGEQQVAFTFGFVGVVSTALSADGTWYVVPRGRLTIGLLERLDLGVQSGWATEVGTGAARWLGTLVDVKVASVRAPDACTLAWGAGGGFGLDLLGNGWGVFGQVLFEIHSPFLPLFVTYRSILPFDGGAIAFEGYLAGGLWLRLSPIARLLLVVGVHGGLASLAAGLEIAF